MKKKISNFQSHINLMTLQKYRNDSKKKLIRSSKKNRQKKPFRKLINKKLKKVKSLEKKKNSSITSKNSINLYSKYQSFEFSKKGVLFNSLLFKKQGIEKFELKKKKLPLNFNPKKIKSHKRIYSLDDNFDFQAKSIYKKISKPIGSKIEEQINNVAKLKIKKNKKKQYIKKSLVLKNKPRKNKTFFGISNKNKILLKYCMKSNKNSLIDKSRNSNKKTLDSNILCNSKLSNEIEIFQIKKKKKMKKIKNNLTNNLIKTKKKKTLYKKKIEKNKKTSNYNYKSYFITPLRKSLQIMLSEFKKGKKLKLDYLEELRLEHFKSTHKKFRLINNLSVENFSKISVKKLDIFKFQHKILKAKYLFLDMDETLIYCSTKCSNREAIPIKTSLTPQTVF